MAWTKPDKCTECDVEFSNFHNFYPEKLSKNEYVLIKLSVKIITLPLLSHFEKSTQISSGLYLK